MCPEKCPSLFSLFFFQGNAQANQMPSRTTLLDRHKPPSAHYGNFSRIPRRGTPAKQVAPSRLIQHWSFCRGKLKFHSMSRGSRGRRDVCPHLSLPLLGWLSLCCTVSMHPGGGGGGHRIDYNVQHCPGKKSLECHSRIQPEAVSFVMPTFRNRQI